MGQPTGVGYTCGSWITITGPVAWLLADVDPTAPLIARCWELVRTGGNVEDVLAAIVHEGFRAVESFALAGAGRVLIRGQAIVDVTTTGGEHRELTAAGAMTWREDHVGEDVAALRLHRGEPIGQRFWLPLPCGVALASAVDIAFVAVANEFIPHTAEPDLSRPEPVVTPPEPVAPHPQPLAPPMADDADNSYDHLFGPTQLPRSMIAPAPPPVDPPPPPLPEPVPATPTPARSTPEPAQLAREAGGVMLDLPWAVPAGDHVPASPSRVVEPEPADLSITLHRPRAGRTGVPASSAPLVAAVRCPAGHLNPPGPPGCRVCGVGIAPQQPFEVVRPPLGVLRLSTDDDPIQLDKGVVLGRAPQRSADGHPVAAHLIALDSPDISRSHVEVRLAGWQVLVVDLGSRNGTLVTRPNGNSTVLESHVPLEIGPGTEISLSDDVWFRFEAAP